jgi:hypothetical protein
VILCTLVTGTIAWLTDKTPTIENTFNPSNIKVALTESNAENNKQDFKMIPGKTYAKDPKVTVAANSEDCYVFVEIKEDLGAWDEFKTDGKTFKSFLDYSLASGWTAVPGTTGVYYIEATANTEKYILAGGTGEYLNGQITVKGNTVTKAMMDKLYVQNAVKPTLTFTAYACQKEGFENDVAAAWAAASANPTNP